MSITHKTKFFPLIKKGFQKLTTSLEVAWSEITGKPATFPADPHTHNLIESPDSTKKIEATNTELIVTGNLIVSGNINQSGALYETNVEKINSEQQLIDLRSGAVSGMTTGEYSGFKILKYDGVNNLFFAVDNTGTARIGVEGGELQALATREESPADGGVMVWNDATKKMIASTDYAKKQTSYIDTETGKSLTVGAFGLGFTTNGFLISAITGSNDLNDLNYPTGFYRYSSTVINNPVPNISGVVQIYRTGRSGGGNIVQVCIPTNNSSTSDLYIRQYDIVLLTWGAFKRINPMTTLSATESTNPANGDIWILP